MNTLKIQREEKGNEVFVRLQKETNGVINPRGLNPFSFQRKNVFLTKTKREEAINKYYMNIRVDGKEENERQFQMAQFEFTKEEMKNFRDVINELLEGDE